MRENSTKDKKKLTKILYFSIFSLVSVFYFYYTAPYWFPGLHFKDITLNGLKIDDSGNVFDLQNGKLTRNHSEQRILSFSINPFTLVENYKVINLALYIQVEKEDPIFSNEGLSSKEFQGSIDWLGKNNQDFKKSMGLKEDIIPVGFLQKVENIIIDKELFNQDHSVSRSRKVLNDYQEAVKSYKSNAENTKKQIEAISKLKEGANFVEYGAITNKQIILDDLNKILVNSKFLQSKVSYRGLCLNSVLFCNRNSIAVNPPKMAQTKPDESPKLIPEKDRYFVADDQQTLKGTYKVSTKCWANQKSNYYLYLYNQKHNGNDILKSEIATTNYYEQLKSDSKDATDQQYLKDGLNWRYTLVSTPYSCNDLEYQAGLSTLDYFYSHFKNKKVFEILLTNKNIDLDERKTFEQGRKLEDDFFGSQYPSEEEMDNLAQAYFYAYSKIVEAENRGVDLFALNNQKDELLTRYLVAKERMANISGILNYFARVNDALSTVTSVDKLDRGWYAQLLRNGYPLTYLGFSPSVYLNNDKLQYILTGAIRSDLKTYEDMIKEFGQDYVDRITGIKRKEIIGQLTNYNY